MSSSNHLFSRDCIIIAEIGINHNGDINIAKKLIEASKKSGFDAVKFQKRDIQTVYSKSELDKPRESPWGTTTREQKEGLEFGKKEYDEINNFCKSLNIKWFASAWDRKSLDFLDVYDLEYQKVASAMITNVSFLEELSKEIQDQEDEFDVNALLEEQSEEEQSEEEQSEEEQSEEEVELKTTRFTQLTPTRLKINFPRSPNS